MKDKNTISETALPGGKAESTQPTAKHAARPKSTVTNAQKPSHTQPKHEPKKDTTSESMTIYGNTKCTSVRTLLNIMNLN